MTDSARLFSDRRVGEMLDALDRAASPVPKPPHLDGFTREETVAVASYLIEHGWAVSRVAIAGGNGLAKYVRVDDIEITDAGRRQCRELRQPMRVPSEVSLDLSEKRRRRLQYLRDVYERTGGSSLKPAYEAQIAEKFGWSQGEIDEVSEYLNGEGLIEYPGMGGQVVLTHRGVVEVEHTIEHPNAATEHFRPAEISAVNVSVHVEGDMVGSNFAVGSGNRQRAAVDIDVLDAARQFSAALRSTLPDLSASGLVDGDEVAADLDALDAQLRSPKPKLAVVQPLLAELAQAVMGGVAGNAAYDGLLTVARQFLG